MTALDEIFLAQCNWTTMLSYFVYDYDPLKDRSIWETLLTSSWPLVGNEGMNPQYTNVKVDSLIPY